MSIFDYNLAVHGLRPDAIPRHLSGVTCDARNCVHHDGDNYCTADRITIGNVIAMSASETRCQAFEPRGEITRK